MKKNIRWRTQYILNYLYYKLFVYLKDSKWMHVLPIKFYLISLNRLFNQINRYVYKQIYFFFFLLFLPFSNINSKYEMFIWSKQNENLSDLPNFMIFHTIHFRLWKKFLTLRVQDSNYKCFEKFVALVI